MNRTRVFLAVVAFGAVSMMAQPYGDADRGAPGDVSIQNHLRQLAEAIEGGFAADTEVLADASRREAIHQEYLYMLGLHPWPAKTPLRATVTGRIERDGYQVDKLHFQSRPGLYVTANLYRPAAPPAGARLPAVLYVCGHSNEGRNGNKTAYQSHGIWLARHGYLCLTLDTLQLGEIGAVHHGTYREGRWWWHSRGYTPAGVECWNGIRAIDYLLERPDVDPERVGVTGISGGGAATFWIAAADPRVKVAVPVSGMADLLAYVPNRVINGHCDCMFLYNTFTWPWTRIAALIAPRPLLFMNSDQDAIFPMDANERVINRLERVYRLHGAGDCVDSVVSVGGHAYRQDLRQAAFRFLNTHLKADPRPVTDTELDLVTDVPGGGRRYPIDPVDLRVFPADADLPADQINTRVDREFVPLAQAPLPTRETFPQWRAALEAELRRVSFRWFPERIPAARPLGTASAEVQRFETEPGIEVQVRSVRPVEAGPVRRVVLKVEHPETSAGVPAWLERLRQPGDELLLCEPRGTGSLTWTRRNPPNYVERSLVLLGRTVDAERIWDVAAVARQVREARGPTVPILVVGEGAAGVIGAYAAVWEPAVTEVVLEGPPASHMDPAAPAILNLLRVSDVPDCLGLLAPRALSLQGGSDGLRARVRSIYGAAGAENRLTLVP